MERAQALAIILCCGLALGCVYPPSTTATPRSPTYVAASFAKTWDAVIDVFAERNIPLRTLDRSSGFAATDELGADGSARWADCGSRAAISAQLVRRRERSEEHTSELQSHSDLVCRLLLEKKHEELTDPMRA